MENQLISYPVLQKDPWSSLRNFTAARIALGNTGGVMPLNEVLALKMAHAHARDAVYAAVDEANLLDKLTEFQLPLLKAASIAKNREEYLLDPGLGRKLDRESVIQLTSPVNPGGIAVIISDGLSATAVNTHAIALLKDLIPLLLNNNKKINSLVLVKQGRVAISDEIGEWCKAEMTLILLGERPGLTAADSIGAYLTFNPKPGLTDESRNCVSNIHPGGLSFPAAAKKITYLVNEAFRIRRSGILLKDQEIIGLE